MIEPISKPLKSARPSGLVGPATRMVGAFTEVPRLIRELGGDPGSILFEAGLDLSDLAQPSARVPLGKLVALLNLAATRIGCEHFGLLAGRVWRLSHLGPIGELMRNSPNVGVALEELVVFQHLNSDGAAAFLLKRDETVDLGYTFYAPIKANTVQFYDAVMAAGVNFMRELRGPHWAPQAVFFPHSPPANLEIYRTHFGSAILFDSLICSLRFRSDELNRSIAGACKELYQLTLQRLESAGSGSTTDVVSRVLRSLLLQGHANKDATVQSLAMHQRTLSRRLKNEGTTFQEILDSVRFAVAKELLESSTVSYEEISVSLGYSQVESFLRAFKKWTGTTPGGWRKLRHDLMA
ncbi:MAG: AraC family transcriptional regulator [Hyphomicrobiales bacterium]|nr:AraC family transcriptional regulator [Hyphomicrobiales bacterium]